MSAILVVDDDDQLRQSFTKLLREDGYTVAGAASGEACTDMLPSFHPDLVILDVCLPGMNGLETFRKIHAREPKLPVIIMTAYGTTETAIEATKMGAFDYILKPFDVPEMQKLIRLAIEAGRFMRSPVQMDHDASPETGQGETLVGRSGEMQAVFKAVGRVAATDTTVMIRGETGTGKELVARAIYQHSHRCDRPFVVINCVALPENLLESELFGYEKGAFTGATHRRIGKIEQAGGGTVFLDEIGDMPITLQTKILRLLQEKKIERLGGRQAIPVDVRIVAATNRDLEQSIDQGLFREDLYYRLKVVTIWLPPLRDRRGDISLLTDYFLKRCSMELGSDNPGITAKAVAQLAALPWNGNVREFSNTIKKILIFNRGGPIDKDAVIRATEVADAELHMKGDAFEQSARKWFQQILRANNEGNLYDRCLDRFSEVLIQETLQLAGGNRSLAAKMLGISRPTLHSKISRYHIRMETTVCARDQDAADEKSA